MKNKRLKPLDIVIKEFGYKKLPIDDYDCDYDYYHDPNGIMVPIVPCMFQYFGKNVVISNKVAYKDSMVFIENDHNTCVWEKRWFDKTTFLNDELEINYFKIKCEIPLTL